MNKPHKHAALIKQWADGAVIQYRLYYDDKWGDMIDPVWNLPGHYRVKPVYAKCRIALMSGNGLHISRDEINASCIEATPHFIRWLTDWIEYEA